MKICGITHYTIEQDQRSGVYRGIYVETISIYLHAMYFGNAVRSACSFYVCVFSAHCMNSSLLLLFLTVDLDFALSFGLLFLGSRTESTSGTETSRSSCRIVQVLAGQPLIHSNFVKRDQDLNSPQPAVIEVRRFVPGSSAQFDLLGLLFVSSPLFG